MESSTLEDFIRQLNGPLDPNDKTDRHKCTREWLAVGDKVLNQLGVLDEAKDGRLYNKI